MKFVSMKIALIAERKKSADNRVALTPVQCVALQQKFPEIKVIVESSEHRCIKDMEYTIVGIPVLKDVSSADVFFGIKEVPSEYLIANKTYFFFSHTIKKQPYNRQMLKDIISKNIRLIDYEVLKWETGQRVLGFGRWAGIIGAYNGLRLYGLKHKLFELNPAWKCVNFAEVLRGALEIKLPPIKMVVTGGGRVSNGSIDFLRNIRVREVTPKQFLENHFDEPVFVHLNSPDLYGHREMKEWNSEYFYSNHSEYFSLFEPYVKVTDILFNGIFWTKDLPPLFTIEQAALPNFKMLTIADISCDVNGSVPVTYKATTIQVPFISWDRLKLEPGELYQEENIDIMAVDNLPNELPEDASNEFGGMLMNSVIPELLKENSDLLNRATICEEQKLTEHFNYLTDFVG